MRSVRFIQIGPPVPDLSYDGRAVVFGPWLPGDAEDEEFTITSEQAYVASTAVVCWECHSKIEVICIHCESGTVADEPLTQFIVSGVWAMDDALARQLVRWPTFRRVQGSDLRGGCFANHCPHCGALQDDLYLHSEPDQPFFGIPRRPKGFKGAFGDAV